MGTHDVSVLEFGDGVFEVLSTEGDTRLGGNDIDNVIIDWIVEEFANEHGGFRLDKDNMAMQRLKESAEKAKIELSSSTMTDISLPYITSIDNAPVHFNSSLTRSKFEQLIAPIVERTIKPCISALKKANLKPSDIDEIILVGGSTRIPTIQDAVEKMFGKTPNKSVNPDEAVAIGAAIQGAILSGDNSCGDVLLLDVTPLSLGLETIGGVFTKLVEANTTIPTSKTEIFSTAMDNQPSVEIVVLQGERPMAKDNKVIGRFHLDGIMSAPKGVPQIEVSFDIDANGILSVSAKDKATGKEQSIRIESGSGLTDEEIQRMKDEAAANEENDKLELDKISTLNMVENTIYQTEKHVEELGDKISDEQKTKLENDMTALKDAFERKDVDACKSCLESVNKTWNEIAVSVYSQGQNQTGEQTQGQPNMEDFMKGDFSGFNKQ
ncbi:MAG: Hsp70 family protein [Lachnospiraceae bacterium]|nr:Hsp70 family protein [Lachnospiraceae bacterium]